MFADSEECYYLIDQIKICYPVRNNGTDYVWHSDCGVLEQNVTYPVNVLVDNVGAIVLSENALVSQRMKHIDVCSHFFWEYIEDGIMKIVFLMSKNNPVDIMTKQIVGETYEDHVESFIAKNR